MDTTGHDTTGPKTRGAARVGRCARDMRGPLARAKLGRRVDLRCAGAGAVSAGAERCAGAGAERGEGGRPTERDELDQARGRRRRSGPPRPRAQARDRPTHSCCSTRAIDTADRTKPAAVRARNPAPGRAAAVEQLQSSHDAGTGHLVDLLHRHERLGDERPLRTTSKEVGQGNS